MKKNCKKNCGIDFLAILDPPYGAGQLTELLEIVEKGHFAYGVQGWLGGRKPGKSTFFFFFRDFFFTWNKVVKKSRRFVGASIFWLGVAGGAYFDAFLYWPGPGENGDMLRKRPPAKKSRPPPIPGISLQLYSM